VKSTGFLPPPVHPRNNQAIKSTYHRLPQGRGPTVIENLHPPLRGIRVDTPAESHIPPARHQGGREVILPWKRNISLALHPTVRPLLLAARRSQYITPVTLILNLPHHQREKCPPVTRENRPPLTLSVVHTRPTLPLPLHPAAREDVAVQ
jgi:hypothetical protein